MSSDVEGIPKVQGCHISLQSFGIAVGPTKKAIIHPISAHITAGSLFAILGGSGSGKTTLLNVLADRYDRNHFGVNGQILFSDPNCHIGYVTQSDFLLPFLTVHETLLFTAKLKLSSADIANGHIDYNLIVEQVLLDLGLRECAHNRIGDDDNALGRRGISGGEKRRVSVGVQILTNPKVLCADEPTSGLDSFTAITVIECLKSMCQRRKTTVVCSIHQPRADIFHMFDDVLLLTKGGHTIYCGSTKEMVPFFAKIGYICPVDANPADFFIDLSSIDILAQQRSKSSKEQKEKCLKRLKHLISAFQSHNKFLDNKKDESIVFMAKNNDYGVNQNYRVSWFTQVRVLCYRFFLNTLRDRSSLLGGIVQAIILGLVLMGIFFNLDESFAAIRSRTGLLYICVSLESYIMMLILVHKYCNEIKILDRELQDNLYHPTAYFIAHLLSSVLPLLFLPMIIFCIPVYFGTGLRLSVDDNFALVFSDLTHDDFENQSGNYFGKFLAVMLTLILCINGVSWTSISLSRLFPIASLISNMSFTFLSLSCGFLVNLEEMPVYIRWLKNITFLSYGYRILMENEFQDRIFHDCQDSAACVNIPGNEILPSYGVKLNNHRTSWPILLSIAIIYHILPMIFLTYLRFPPTSSSSSLEAANSAPENSDAFDFDGDEEDELKLLESLALSTSDAVDQVEDQIGEVELFAIPTELSGQNLSDTKIQSISDLNFAPVHSSASEVDKLWNISVRKLHLFAKVSPNHQQQNHKRVPYKQLLFNIHIDIPAGKLVAILGGSGSGKSTLLNLIANRIPLNVLSQNANSVSAQSSNESFAIKASLCGNISGESVYSGTGLVLFNNKRPTSELVRNLVGYVQQNDYHLPSLTVNETLMFHAKLRLSSTFVSSRKQFQVDNPNCHQESQDTFNRHRVHSVMEMLGLLRCRNICVGNAEKKGISGGEKRRLSVGVQLLSDPSVCLLDEPTTGLDSFTARHVVLTLKHLAAGLGYMENLIAETEEEEEESENKRTQLQKQKSTFQDTCLMQRPRTVVLSIHQPRYDVFALFDQIVLLSKGHVLWCGQAAEMLTHFANLGYECPKLCNPADFVLDISSIDMRSELQEKESRDRWQLLVQAYDTYSCDQLALEEGSIITANSAILENAVRSTEIAKTQESTENEHVISNEKSFIVAFPLLLSRAWLNLYRQPELLTVRLTQTLFYALILCTYFAPVQNTQQSIQNRVGSLYEFTALTFVGMLNCIAIFPIERNVFYREYFDGYYSAWSFITVYFALAGPLSLVAAAIFSVLMSCAVGLQPTFVAFVQFTFITWTFLMSGEAMGVLFCTLFDEIGFSVNVVSVVISFFGVMAGFISPTMNDGLVYLSYLSPMRWGAYLLMHISFAGETFSCDSSYSAVNSTIVNNQTVTAVPCLSTGEEVLKLYRFGDSETFKNGLYGESFHYYMSAIVMFIFILISIFSTRFRAFRFSH